MDPATPLEQRPAVDQQFGATVEIGRHGRERDAQAFEEVRHAAGPKSCQRGFGVDQHRVGQPPAEQLGEAADAGLEQLRHGMVTPPKDAQEMASERSARMPRRVSRTDDGADGATGDGDRRDAELVQDLQQDHVGEAPRSPGPERQAETFGPYRRGATFEPFRRVDEHQR